MTLPSQLTRWIESRPLLAAALLVGLVKAIQFAVDSQALFLFDSGAFLMNALGLQFVTYRSYVYGGLIRFFAVPFHSFRAIVGMQILMGGLTAWLLAFSLVRYFAVRPLIALVAALAFSFDPVQIVYERMVMTETAALLATALFLVTALQYQRDFSPRWLVLLAFLGALLVSLRTVYIPVVLAAAVLVPLWAWLAQDARRPRVPAMALLVSCGSALVFQAGYRDLTGLLAHREPAYSYAAGFFLLANAAPLVEAGDSPDPRVAQAVEEQSNSSVPLLPNLRPVHMWQEEGLLARLRKVFGGDERKADQAAQQLARSAILRNPFGYLKLGARTYAGYWRGLPNLRWELEGENVRRPLGLVTPRDAQVISSVFRTDVSNRDMRSTPSRRYHVVARYWYLFLLLTPFLAGLTWALRPPQPAGIAMLLVWSCLLLAATCMGAIDSPLRYLHPFSFIGLAATAILAETCARQHAAGSSPVAG